jgi:hypothetical protein
MKKKTVCPVCSAGEPKPVTGCRHLSALAAYTKQHAKEWIPR